MFARIPIMDNLREIDRKLLTIEEKMGKIKDPVKSKLFRLLAHQHAELIAKKSRIILENRKESTSHQAHTRQNSIDSSGSHDSRQQAQS